VTLRRAAAATALSAAVVLVTASPAFAHADLEESTPVPEARVATARHVRLAFDEPVQPAGTGVQVRDGDGDLVASLPSAPRRTDLDVSLPDHLGAGVYTVGWVVLSGDTDIVSGSYQFTVTSGSAGSSTSPWVAGSVAVAALAAAAAVVALRRRSRVGAVAALLVLAGSGLLLVSRLGGSSGPRADVSADPAAVGLNTVTLTLADTAPADQVDVRLVLDRTHTVVDVPVTAAGNGVYRARDVVLPLSGDWRAAVAVRRGARQQLLDGAFAVDPR